jgi:membrane protease YdiL (CAAX protease family)
VSGIPPRPDDLHPVEAASAATAPSSATTTWGAGEAIVAYVLGFLGSAILVTPLLTVFGASPTVNSVANVVVALATLGVLVLWLRIRHPGALAAIGLRAARPLRDLRDGVVFGLLLYPAVAFVAATLVQTLIRVLTGAEASAPQQVPTDLSPVGTAVVVAYAVLVAPFAEEFFFRGILFSALASRYGFAAGALGSAVLFGLIHFVPAPWPDAVLLITVMVPTGFGLAWIRARRGSLYASIGAHLAFNVIGLVLIFAAR